MKTSVTVYATDWGEFEMPEGLEERTEWVVVEREFLQGRIAVREPANTPNNREFFEWLHQQEVAAGKPESD